MLSTLLNQLSDENMSFASPCSDAIHITVKEKSVSVQGSHFEGRGVILNIPRWSIHSQIYNLNIYIIHISICFCSLKYSQMNDVSSLIESLYQF